MFKGYAMSQQFVLEYKRWASYFHFDTAHECVDIPKCYINYLLELCFPNKPDIPHDELVAKRMLKMSEIFDWRVKQS